jgi:hypothetical protein
VLAAFWFAERVGLRGQALLFMAEQLRLPGIHVPVW